MNSNRPLHFGCRLRALHTAHVTYLLSSAAVSLTLNMFDYQGLNSPRLQATPPTRHPLDVANAWSKAIFSWASPLIALGNERQLAPPDMWTVQDANRVDKLVEKYSRVYEMHDRRLFKTFFAIYMPKIVLVGVLQVLSAGCSLFGPSYILPQIIDAVQASSTNWTRAVLLVVALYAVQMGGALMQAHLSFINSVIGIQFSAFLRSKLFSKALNLSTASRQETTAGDIANLISVDILNFVVFSTNLNMLWIVPIQVAVVLYLIQRQVGWAIYVGLGAVVLIVLVTMVFTTFIGQAQMRQMGFKDDRMKVLNELFGAIQIVKFNAWEETFVNKIMHLRDQELRAILSYIRSLLVIVTSMYTAPVLIAVIVFATYSVWMGKVLTVSIVFTTLALCKYLQDALVQLPSTVVDFIDAIVSAKRLAQVLAMEERDPTNVSKEPPKDCSGAAITITDGSFGWDAEKPFFEHLNWTVQRGEFVVVHGGVGTGKSSLCSILLGEMTKFQGSVSVAGRVAYFAQQSWIQNATIRENILFAKPYDAAKYCKVLDACALTEDLVALPAGDRTEIGLKGVNLSGGQKARVSLARACYSDADIFIFDAPLAALDAIVSNQVFQKCFLGLLQHKTVVLVTHNPDVIDSPAVDRCFQLQDGRLVERVSTPRSEKPSVASPTLSPLRAHLGSWEDQTTTLSHAEKYDLLVTPSGKSPYHSDAGMVFTPRKSSPGAADGETLIVDEARAEGRVSKDVVLSYLSAVGGWCALAVMLFWTIATEGVRVASDMWLAHWSNSSNTKSEAEFRADSNNNLIVYSGLVLVLCVLTVVQVYVVLTYGLRGSKLLFRQMLDGLVQAPMRFFDTNPIGRILNRFGDDIFQCDIRLPLSFAPILVEVAMALSKIVTSIAIVQYMGLLLPPLVYAYVKLGAYFLAPLREVNRIKKTMLSPLLSLVSEAIDGAVVIRAFGERYQRRFTRLHDLDVNNYSASSFAQVTVMQWFNLRVHFVSNSIVLVILLGAVVASNRISPALVGLAITYGLNIPSNLEGLVSLWASLETALIAPERVHEYANVPSEGQRTTPLVLEAAWPAHGQIEFDDVSFRYKPEDPLVLKHVSFSVRGGEKIGVVGRTGAGKSSLMMTLFRINEVATGTIKIDGVDIAAVGLKRLRSSLAIIPQNPVLFKGTLRNYMDPFDEFTDEQLW
ncbi:hypothetical protein As57867_004518, partial [Aphanomyces stellatus]